MQDTQGTTKEDPVYSSFLENTRKMNYVIHQMKQYPDIPSEQPNDVNPLRQVEFPDKGGVLTYMSFVDSTAEVEGHVTQIFKDHPYPYKGFPFGEFVEKIDYVKKIGRGILSGFYHRFKVRSRLTFITLIPSLWVFKDSVRVFVYTFHRLINRFKVKPEMYCPATSELFRAFSFERMGEDDGEKEFRLLLRDVVCMFLEFDNAYRFRFQDVFVELDKKLLEKNPVKEIVRLLELMQSREITQEIKDTWTLLILFSKYYLRFDKKLLYLLRDALYQVNTNQVALDEGDQHFCKPRKDYKFKFMEK